MTKLRALRTIEEVEKERTVVNKIVDKMNEANVPNTSIAYYYALGALHTLEWLRKKRTFGASISLSGWMTIDGND